MKTPKCRKGPEARENFERGMIALFKVPKEAVDAGRKEAEDSLPRRRENAARARTGWILPASLLSADPNAQGIFPQPTCDI
jgi:hypothetical protein